MSKGGIFNCASVDLYSPSTMRTLKELMQEAHLSISLRRKFEGKLRSGESLPKPRAKSAPPKSNENLFDMKKNAYFMKRSRQQIEKATAHECDYFRPKSAFPATDRSKDKEKLQNLMEFGNFEGDMKPQRKPKEILTLTRQDRLNELAREIEERVQFVEDMKSLGEGKRYEQEIKQEISQKLREVKNLQAMTDTDFAALQVTAYKS